MSHQEQRKHFQRVILPSTNVEISFSPLEARESVKEVFYWENVLTCPGFVVNLKVSLQQQKGNTTLPTCSSTLWIELSKYFLQLRPGEQANTLLLLRPITGTNYVLCFALKIITNIKHLARIFHSFSFHRFSKL